jgi:hypothetical protein
MRDWLVLMAHLIVTIMAPGGARTVVAESLLLKHQLLIRANLIVRSAAPTHSWAASFLLFLKVMP